MQEKRSGFTLIELLVVVLIIGILAAIALPQYQKAVERAKAVQAITLLRSLRDSFERYKLANSVYPNKFSDLDIEIPFTGNTQYETRWITDTLSNEDWSLQIQDHWISNKRALNVVMTRLSGPYRGASLTYNMGAFFEDYPQYPPSNELVCHELKGYCRNVIHGTEFKDPWNTVYYKVSM